MFSCENIKLEILGNIEKRRKIWEEGEKTSRQDERLGRFASAEKHIDEATRTYIVAACRDFAELYTRNSSVSAKEMKMWSCVRDLRLSEEDLESLKLSQYDVKDDLIQRMYEKFGFEDKVPTDLEISRLEAQKEKNEISEVEKWELEKQIRLMQIKRGENCIDGGLPYVFEEDVTERYDKIIMEVTKRETRQEAVSENFFSKMYHENGDKMEEALKGMKSDKEQEVDKESRD